ncbi:hypothetical protein RJ639_029458 [Escallonia herrerae]|uniref:WAT1-related protein n=1 Tax=Escallonia herrerae TaxID=1293975 RepID=A0AA88QEQ2_9ASTE|nr:hypothetical protein RJ639_029458 [Escallonia herrerae]
MVESVPSSKRGLAEDVALIAGLVVMQFMIAGNTVALSYFMSLGLHPSSLIIPSAFATFLVLSPIATYFERSKWPKKFSWKLLVRFVLIGLGGVTLFQSLLLKGINLTSPAMATAMPNLAPGLIFLIAWAFGLETVKPNCMYSKIKVVGTLLCVVGAVTMSLSQSVMNGHLAKEDGLSSPSPPADDHNMFDEQKIIGCIYLLASVLVLSSSVVLQASTLTEFPAPISLCAITSLFGAILTLVVELIQGHHIETGWPLLSVHELIGYSLLVTSLPSVVLVIWFFIDVVTWLTMATCRLSAVDSNSKAITYGYVQQAGTVTGACLSFNGWALKKRGPVLVSMFNPIGTVLSVIFSIFAGDTIGLGSISGMLLMFTGLYFVLWAKGKEGIPLEDVNSASKNESDAEKPLLS